MLTRPQCMRSKKVIVPDILGHTRYIARKVVSEKSVDGGSIKSRPPMLYGTESDESRQRREALLHLPVAQTSRRRSDENLNE